MWELMFQASGERLDCLIIRDGEDIYWPMQLPELPEEEDVDDDKHANQQK